MKTTRYKFEAAIQAVSEDKTEWLIGEFKSVLESDKDFTRKCDYIGYSIASIDSKVASLDEEIKELQQLKKNLKSAKDIALTTGAKVFTEYGIDKLEGAGISSITLTKPSTKIKEILEVKDEEALIGAGFYKQVLDEEAVIQAINSDPDSLAYMNVEQYASLNLEEITTASKLKINKRRTSNTIEDISLKEAS